MKVLLTGTTGYIGRRLLPELVARGHKVVCPVRDRRRFDFEDFSEEFLSQVEVIEADFNQEETMGDLPDQIDTAYYLIHSMNSRKGDFQHLEERSARNFARYAASAGARQIIYLGGIANDTHLSRHLKSRQRVEEILKSTGVPVTVLRSGIIIGSGSSSFEIIRDLVEKLPVMIAPRWLNKRCQPISISNVLEYLLKVHLNEPCMDRTFDIGGITVLTYKDMLLEYAKVRNLKRVIISVPVLSPRLSSLWLYFVTTTPFHLARNLVDSIRNEVVCADDAIDSIIPLSRKHSYRESLTCTLEQLRTHTVVSSWKDTFLNPEFNSIFLVQKEAPQHGVLQDIQEVPFTEGYEEVLENIWSIGGERGWYYGNLLWELRGFLDLCVGGVGLRRGRRSQTELKNGDSLDFWRVLHADKNEPRLLLLAEMKVPGEAWLEFKIRKEDNKYVLIQTATFRPHGVLGRIYWYSLVPFHIFIFNGMVNRLVTFRSEKELATGTF